MSIARLLPALLAPLALAACVVPIPLPPGTPGAIEIVLDEGDSCGARGLRSLIGQPAATAEATRILGRDGQPAAVRVIRPGDAVTQDLQPARVNLRIGADGTVAAIDCG